MAHYWTSERPNGSDIFRWLFSAPIWLTVAFIAAWTKHHALVYGPHVEQLAIDIYNIFVLTPITICFFICIIIGLCRILLKKRFYTYIPCMSFLALILADGALGGGMVRGYKEMVRVAVAPKPTPLPRPARQTLRVDGIVESAAETFYAANIAALPVDRRLTLIKAFESQKDFYIDRDQSSPRGRHCPNGTGGPCWNSWDVRFRKPISQWHFAGHYQLRSVLLSISEFEREVFSAAKH